MGCSFKFAPGPSFSEKQQSKYNQAKAPAKRCAPAAKNENRHIHPLPVLRTEYPRKRFIQIGYVSRSDGPGTANPEKMRGKKQLEFISRFHKLLIREGICVNVFEQAPIGLILFVQNLTPVTTAVCVFPGAALPLQTRTLFPGKQRQP